MIPGCIFWSGARERTRSPASDRQVAWFGVSVLAVRDFGFGFIPTTQRDTKVLFYTAGYVPH